MLFRICWMNEQINKHTESNRKAAGTQKNNERIYKKKMVAGRKEMLEQQEDKKKEVQCVANGEAEETSPESIRLPKGEMLQCA